MNTHRSLALLALGAAAMLATADHAVRTRTALERLESRGFPRVFMPWNGIAPPPGDALEAAARHDLLWLNIHWFGLEPKGGGLIEWTGFTEASIEAARAKVDRLRTLNPDMIVMVEMRYRDAPDWALPEDHAIWLRDDEGERVMSWPEGGYLKLDTDSPDLRAMVARQSAYFMSLGIFDGLFFDWWYDAEPDRLRLMEAVRAKVPDETVIVVNANDNTIPNTAHLVNGSFMECWASPDWGTWGKIEETLVWLESNTRQPRVNALSTWWATGRDEFDRVRATTALALTRSDGFALFTDPNDLPTPDHLHDWYAFWDTDLGRPEGPGREHEDGTVRRAFQRGTVVYNRPGQDEVVVRFETPRTSVRTGRTARTHALPSPEGDIYLPTEPR